ncbi:MAG: PTS sugar transporter subunit IIA [Kiritimatiellae bacterium]|nr:PTS sugar transporter subunit IIA [Kiritimatiellia bacterium]
MKDTTNDMTSTINQLIQLQELIIAKTQRLAASPQSNLSLLDENIASMRKCVAPKVLQDFDRLLQKSQIAIVPMEQGKCTACNMTLPVSLVHQVHAAEAIYHCPSCARLLFYRDADSSARNTRPPRKRTEAPKTGIAKFSSDALMVPDLEGKDAESVIRELAEKLKDAKYIDDAEKLVTAAMAREAVDSTALENGCAFPHARGIEGGALSFALGIAKKPIAFDSSKKASTQIVVLMVIPTAASTFYLKLIAGFNRVLMVEKNRDALLATDTPEKMWKTLVKLTAKDIP